MLAMRLTLARYLVLLLALVVPLQGTAAVVAELCMTLGHHDVGAAHQGVHTGASSDHANHHGAHSDHHHSGDDHSADDGKGTHCGPNSACASASIPAHSGLPVTADRSTAAYVFSPLPLPSIQLDGLDRPPLAL